MPWPAEPWWLDAPPGAEPQWCHRQVSTGLSGLRGACGPPACVWGTPDWLKEQTPGKASHQLRGLRRSVLATGQSLHP